MAHRSLQEVKHSASRRLGTRITRFVPSRLLALAPNALYYKTVIIIATTLCGLIVLVFIPLYLIVLNSFVRLEEQRAQQDIERSVNTLTDTISSLDRTTADYAGWDDTYFFMENPDQSYIDANMADGTFVSNRLSLWLLVDQKGSLVTGKGFDLNTRQPVALPQRLRLFHPNETLLQHTDVGSRHTGLLLLEEGPLLVSSRPILTSKYTGPIHGTLIMGRMLDRAEVQRLSDLTDLSISVYRVDDANLPADVIQARQALEQSNARLIRPLDDHLIAGYAVLPDIDNRPALVLRVTENRDIYAQGYTSTVYFMLSLLAAGVGFGIVVMALLKRVVLSRLAKLSYDVEEIGSQRDLSARVALAGTDELALLADTINTTLARLEQSQIERRLAEEERARLQEEVVRAQEHFTQMIIHDLKSPLTGLVGFLDLLHRTPLSTDQREILNGARRGGQHLDQLILTILDTARLEEGQLQIRPEPTGIQELLQSCADELQAWAAQEEKEIQLNIDAELPLQMIDAGLIRRVIMNLLSNAIKHTPFRTVIELGAGFKDTSLQLWVADNGPGIGAEHQEKLFQRFSSTQKAKDRHNNTGLGLIFCKMAVEAHGGTINVNSNPQDGTIFQVSLPQYPVE